MATLTAYPTSNAAISGTPAWASPTNAYGAPNATVATWTTSTSNATSVIEYGTYDFSAIPASSTINSVTLGVTQGCNNTARMLAPQYQPMLAGAASGTLLTGTLQTALTLNSNAITTFTLAQLQTANNVRVRITARHYNGTQSGIQNLDAVALTVDYTPPPTIVNGTATGLFGFSASAAGTVVPAGGTIIEQSTFEVNVENHVVWFSCTVARDSGAAHGGTWSLLCTTTAAFGSGVQLDNFPFHAGIIAGNSYDFECWYIEAVATMPTATWTIAFHDEAGTTQGSTQTISMPRVTSWTKVSGTFVAPANSTRVSWTFQWSTPSSAGQALRIDDILVRETSAGATVTGTATGTFGFTGPAAGVPVVLGTTTGGFGFAATAAGTKIITGTATGLLGFNSPASGTVTGGGATVTGTATSVFGFAAPTSGQPIKLGTASGAFGFTATATGQPIKLGTATSSFGFTSTATGTKIVTGTGTGTFVFAAPAAGAAFKLGTATGILGFGSTATGITVGAVFGTATGLFGLNSPATGTKAVVGISTQGFGFTSAATGQPERLGTATSLFGFVATAQGSKIVTGAATGAYGFDAPASGTPVAGGVTTGTATATFGFNSPATGSKTVLGTTAGLFGFAAPAAGGATTPTTGTATSLLGFTAPAAGVRIRLGTTADNLGFTATPAGQLIRPGTATGELGFTAAVSANPPPDYNGGPWNTTTSSTPAWATSLTTPTTTGPINDEWETSPTSNQWQATLTPQWATQ